ncbi:hypothetical protein MDA_GLEAN10025822 [Myotis davidii]|uniref:Uncharacterized protein n=1 Tax=Myotis davidii TaxID=225400 RepID=L5LXR4_MYODS|nr:hypothetical protein MDA_GLEAN10025822 [Myotis davidii]
MGLACVLESCPRVAVSPRDGPESLECCPDAPPLGCVQQLPGPALTAHMGGLWEPWQKFRPQEPRGSFVERLPALPPLPHPRCACRHLVTVLWCEGQFAYYRFII